MTEGTKQLAIAMVTVVITVGIIVGGFVMVYAPSMAHATEARPHWTAPPLYHSRFDHVDAKKIDLRSFTLGCDVGSGPTWPIVANIR